MEDWKVTITAEQPISIAASNHNSNNWDTSMILRGSTIRGAVAEKWRQEVGFDHDGSDQFFQKGIWRDAHEFHSFVVPLNYRAEKYSGNQHDLLYPIVREGEKLPIFSPSNDNPLVETGNYNSSIRLNEMTGIAIGEARQSTINGQIYSMNSIAEGYQFSTIMRLPEVSLSEIADEVKENDQSYTLTAYIGKKTSAGFGRVHIQFDKTNPVTAEEVKQRVMDDSLNEDVQLGELFIRINHLSPTILYNHYLQPRNQMNWTEDVLPEHPELSQKLSYEKNWGKSQKRHGWNAKWQMPKSTEWTLIEGSVSVAQFVDLTDEDQSKLFELLADLMNCGLGDRVNEGFGEIGIGEVSIKSELKQEEQNQFDTESMKHLAYNDAKKFYEEVKDQIHSISTSQWHQLLSISNFDIVEEITSEQEDKYLEKRKRSRFKHGWDTMVSNETLSDIFRRYVADLACEAKQNNKGDTIKQFIQYVIGMNKISEMEGDSR